MTVEGKPEQLPAFTKTNSATISKKFQFQVCKGYSAPTELIKPKYSKSLHKRVDHLVITYPNMASATQAEGSLGLHERIFVCVCEWGGGGREREREGGRKRERKGQSY